MMRAVTAMSVVTVFLASMLSGTHAAAAVDCPASVPAPQHQAGETWTWLDSRGGKLTEAVQAEGDLTQMKSGSGDIAFHDRDLVVRYVKRRSGEIVRTQTVEPAITGLHATNATVGHKTLDFPLQVGKQWTYSYIASASRGGRGTATSFWLTHKVVGCEEVSTPAGKFPALKLEITEHYGDRATGSMGPPTMGVSHLWYAPQVKNYVKRHYDPSPNYSGLGYRDFELVKYAAPGGVRLGSDPAPAKPSGTPGGVAAKALEGPDIR